MKTVLTSLLLLAGLNLAHATDTPSAMSAEQARATWQAMTPEQQAAAKAMMKTQSQEKQAAWGALSEEEQAAKKAAAKDKFAPHRAAMQARMAARPFGQR